MGQGDGASVPLFFGRYNILIIGRLELALGKIL
jgi:hypothetical protein